MMRGIPGHHVDPAVWVTAENRVMLAGCDVNAILRVNERTLA
jgi:hypothetical protein